MRIALPNELGDGDGYAHVVLVDAHAERRWREIKQCQALLQLGRAPRSATASARPDRVALAHLRSLQALDGAFAGATQREIASVVFGQACVANSWHADGELRAQIRYLIRRGRAFISGGYVRLVYGAARRTPRAPITEKGRGR